MSSRSLRKGEGKGKGRCQLKTSKCQRHSTLCCKKCHKLDKNGKLKEVVKYKPNTETQCEWTGLITSMGNHCLKYHGIPEGARKYWKEIHKGKAINPFTRARKSQNQENPTLQNQNISTADLDINESDDADRVHVPDSAVSGWDDPDKLLCCDQPWDQDVSYIECASNHPACYRWIHVSPCSGLDEEQFQSLRYSTKKYFCPSCTAMGIKKPLTIEEIAEERDRMRIAIEKMAENEDVESEDDGKEDEKDNDSEDSEDPEIEILSFKHSRNKPVVNRRFILDQIMNISHPKPSSKNKKKPIEANPNYDSEQREAAWDECVGGMYSQSSF